MTVEKFHPTAVATVQGSKELGQQVMALRYDLVRETLQGMAGELERQIDGDQRRGRPKLATRLRTLHGHVSLAVDAAGELVSTVEPWLREEQNAASAQKAEPIPDSVYRQLADVVAPGLWDTLAESDRQKLREQLRTGVHLARLFAARTY